MRERGRAVGWEKPEKKKIYIYIYINKKHLFLIVRENGVLAFKLCAT